MTEHEREVRVQGLRDYIQIGGIVGVLAVTVWMARDNYEWRQVFTEKVEQIDRRVVAIESNRFTLNDGHALQSTLRDALSLIAVSVEATKGLTQVNNERIRIIESRMGQLVDAINNIERAVPPFSRRNSEP